MRSILFVITFFILVNGFGQENHKVNLIDYIREIQIWEKNDNNLSLSFWIPISYWGINLTGNPQVPVEIIDQITYTFKDYVFICALNLEINYNGSTLYTNEEDLRKTLSIEDSIGQIYYPLEDSILTPHALYLLQSIKPMFSQMFGEMGVGMHFYFFSIKDQEGNPIIDEYKKGKFTIRHSNKKFVYNLPLLCLLPPKFCPIDSAEMKGNWNYCPFHGLKLQKTDYGAK
jgi:hypothetical protein